MLRKLFKLEFTWVNKFFPWFALGAVVFALGSRLTNDLTSVAGLIIHNTLQSIAISVVVSLICNVFARSFVHFKAGLFKDEAYLTHTLPVEKSELWNTRVLSFLLSTFLCIVLLLTTLAILFMNETIWSTIKNVLAEYQVASIFFVLTFFFEVITLGLSVFNGILIGHRKDTKRNLRSVLISLGIYYLTQVFLLGIAFILSILLPSLKTVFADSSSLSFTEFTLSLKNFFILSGTYYVAVSVALYFLGKHILSKGIDVE